MKLVKISGFTVCQIPRWNTEKSVILTLPLTQQQSNIDSLDCPSYYLEVEQCSVPLVLAELVGQMSESLHQPSIP